MTKGKRHASTDKGSVRGFLPMVLSLLAFWLLVSGSVDGEHLLVGFLAALLIAFFWREVLVHARNRHDLLPWDLLRPSALRFLPFLAMEVFKANLVMARIVLSRRPALSCEFVVVPTALERDLVKVALANCITLTPGTITVDLEGDRLTVHAITREAARGVEDRVIEEHLRPLERGVRG
ncbi:MAG: Na+/H+ antiporter subunit E [bacterium]|nr:Na+/H+ antiporter subunit E [bacterium]